MKRMLCTCTLLLSIRSHFCFLFFFFQVSAPQLKSQFLAFLFFSKFQVETFFRLCYFWFLAAHLFMLFDFFIFFNFHCNCALQHYYLQFVSLWNFQHFGLFYIFCFSLWFLFAFFCCVPFYCFVFHMFIITFVIWFFLLFTCNICIYDHYNGSWF